MLSGHLTDDDFTRLENVLKEWEERVRAGEEYSDLDETYHQIIYNVLDNQTMMKLFSAFWVSFTSLDEKIIHDTDPQDVLNLHRELLNAIRTRDPNLTRRKLSQHFDHVRKRIDNYLGGSKSKK